MKKYLFFVALLILAVAAVITSLMTIEYWNQMKAPDLPPAQQYDDLDEIAIEAETVMQLDTVEDVMVEEVLVEYEAQAVNLAVSFQSQAPFANWEMPYKEGCEEASLIMVDYYLRGESLSKQQMDDEIVKQVAWQEENYEGHFDLPLEMVANMAKAVYSYEVDIIPELTIDNVLEQLAHGRPVIVPSAGRELGNPNFKIPGPLYHMLVIKGYTEDGKFITNDPGTRNGADYLYDPDVLMAAIRDWDGSQPEGKKVGLIMYN